MQRAVMTDDMALSFSATDDADAARQIMECADGGHRCTLYVRLPNRSVEMKWSDDYGRYVIADVQPVEWGETRLEAVAAVLFDGQERPGITRLQLEIPDDSPLARLVVPGKR